jgi:hypothetical protein
VENSNILLYFFSCLPSKGCYNKLGFGLSVKGRKVTKMCGKLLFLGSIVLALAVFPSTAKASQQAHDPSNLGITRAIYTFAA